MTDKTNNPTAPFDPDTEETPDEFLVRNMSSQADLRNAVAALIRRRELLRDCEIELLEHHCDKLIEQIADTKQKILLEELDCFKEVIRLHKRLIENDAPRH